MQKFDITIDRDLFDYGYDILNGYIFLVLLSVVFSMIFGILKELLLFYVFFIPLRKNIGGFHFENKKTCFICSVIMGIVSAGIIQAKLFVSIKWIITFLIMFINVCLLGCQQHPNKQLTSSEKNKYKRKGLFFIAIFTGLGIYFLQYKNLEMYNSIILTAC